MRTLIIANSLKSDQLRQCYDLSACLNRDPSLFPYRKARRKKELLDKTTSDGQRTEAYAYVGLNQLAVGDRKAAATSCGWVKEHGDKRYVEFEIALNELAKIGMTQ